MMIRRKPEMEVLEAQRNEAGRRLPGEFNIIEKNNNSISGNPILTVPKRRKDRVL